MQSKGSSCIGLFASMVVAADAGRLDGVTDAGRLGGVTGADLGASPELRRLDRRPSAAVSLAGNEVVLLVCLSPRDGSALRRGLGSESMDARQRLLEPHLGRASSFG